MEEMEVIKIPAPRIVVLGIIKVLIYVYPVVLGVIHVIALLVHLVEVITYSLMMVVPLRLLLNQGILL